MTSQISRALPLAPDDGLAAPVSLSGHLSIFHDSSGALSIDDIVSGRPDVLFESIPSMLTQGYRPGALWARFSLSAPDAPTDWLLQIERPLIEQVSLYAPDGAEGYSAVPSGRRHPGGLNGAGAYPAIFPIAVPSTQVEYYLRLQSSTSMTTVLNIWQPDGYDEYRRADDWIMGIFVGAIFIMILTNLLFYFWLKDGLYALYCFLLVESSLISIFHMGYASEIFGFLSAGTIHRSWGIIVCLYSIAMMLFLARLFEFHKHWTWAWRVSQGVVFLNGIALVYSIMGRYSEVGFYVSRLQQLSLIFVAVLVVYLVLIRRQYQYVLSAIAFLSVISVLSLMQMMYTGANPFQLDGSLSRFLAAGTLIHLVLFSAAVAKRAQLAERSLREEKDRVIAVSQEAGRNLIVKVRERTAELAEKNALLNEEVARRHVLETKLRQSLEAVNDALKQERDFLALVSHEFRGPLSVIAAAANNLTLTENADPQNVRLRASRISRTVARMSALIENVLTGDRLQAGQSLVAASETFDAGDLVRLVQSGLDDESARRIKFDPGNPVILSGSRHLLEMALQNLINNALKYSPSDSDVFVDYQVSHSSLTFHVKDRGYGVASDEREIIFMRNRRGSRQMEPGAGLGLYIAREIARQHGGDVKIVASGPTGSTFTLELPL